MQFSSNSRAQSDFTIPGQSGPGSNGNEGLLCIPQSPSITGTSPSDCLVSYAGHSFGGGSSPLHRCSLCILQLRPTGQCFLWLLCDCWLVLLVYSEFLICLLFLLTPFTCYLRLSVLVIRELRTERKRQEFFEIQTLFWLSTPKCTWMCWRVWWSSSAIRWPVADPGCGSRTRRRPTSPKRSRLGFRRSATTLYTSLIGPRPEPAGLLRQDMT